MTAPWQLFLTSADGRRRFRRRGDGNRRFAKRNGLACLMASLLVLRITRTQPDVCSDRLTGPRTRSKRRSSMQAKIDIQSAQICHIPSL
jgi:hypothetical protein